MLLLALLVAASSPADDAIQQQAARCGLKPDQLVWTVEADRKRRAHITPNGNLDGLSATALICMVKWAEKTGARIGFISEPKSVPTSKP